MVDHSVDATPAPTQDDLYELAVTQTQALEGVIAGCERYHSTPGTWPHLAAVLDNLGRKLTAHAMKLSDALWSYAEAHPGIEVPEAPGVLLLTGERHASFWDEARMVGHLDDTLPSAAGYGAAVFGEYGRPDLAHRVVSLDDDEDGGAVLVVLFVAEAGRDAVVFVLIGGLALPEDEAQVQAALARENITPGRMWFWAPSGPPVFISLDDPDVLYDAYGRRVQISDPGNTPVSQT